MAVRTREELLNILQENQATLGDLGISLLEDVSDSFQQPVDISQYVSKSQYDSLQSKYISRFNGNVDTTTPYEKEHKEPEKTVWTLDKVLGRTKK